MSPTSGQNLRIFPSYSASPDIPFDFANDLFGLYLVQESDAVATVCVAVVGMLDREVVLSLATSDATALAGGNATHSSTTS